ncbi:hypothetical protein LXA43DRAFT_903493, partial [Ganoderma leucocontextum]
DSPQNGLAMDTSVQYAFQRFMFCLRPTEVHIKPEIRFNVLQNVRDHITFVDHSITSPLVQQAAAMFGYSPPRTGVDLPCPDLLRLHAALGWVLRLSGAGAVFDALYRPPPSRGSAAYPSPSGATFWRSVVEYEGPAVCLEAELRDSIAALVCLKD